MTNGILTGQYDDTRHSGITIPANSRVEIVNIPGMGSIHLKYEGKDVYIAGFSGYLLQRDKENFQHKVEALPKGLSDKDLALEMNEWGMSMPLYMEAIDHYKSLNK